jgi:hypothetical protein
MNKILNGRLYFLPLFIMIVALFSACKKNVENPPVITEVRSYVATPNDTVLHSLDADGQWVVITGQNLHNALEIKFNGVPASFNPNLFASNSAVVQIPTIFFSSIDTTKLYTIEYTTTGGSTTFPFILGPGAPTIAAISNVFANPGDSVFLLGANLVLVQSFSYAGSNITSFKSNLDGTALGFLMPAQQPTDQILLTTKGGSVAFKIEATPTITGVTNENVAAGDSVYVYGTYLKSIETFTFGGASITSSVSSADGSSVGFVMPSGSTGGPVSITTPFGTATTVFNVKDVKTGNLANFEGGNGWQWWGGSSLKSGDPSSSWPAYIADFPGNPTHFQVLKTKPLSKGEGNTWSSYAVRVASGQWIPAANLSDPISDWALKFEVNIKEPWNGGTINIQSTDGKYIARWEPWQVSATTTAAIKTKGWTTITIPFSMFKAKDATLGDGKGVSISTFTELLGTSGKSECLAFIKNYSDSDTPTGFYGAFDNFRVVKIK